MPAPTQPSNPVLLERIEGIRCDVAEIKETIDKFIEEQRTFRLSYEQRHAVLTSRVDLSQAKIEEHEKKITHLDEEVEKLADLVKPMVSMMRIIGFVSSALGLSILALIWSIITHQVILTF